MLGTGNLRIIVEVLLAGLDPSIVAGLRVAAGLGWQSLVGAELIVASAGIGFMMVQAQLNISTPTVMAGMIAIGLVGSRIDVALRALEAACAPPGSCLRARMAAITFEAVRKTFGPAQTFRRWSASTSPSPTRSSSPSSDRRAAARPPACVWRPGLNFPTERHGHASAAGTSTAPGPGPRGRFPAVRTVSLEDPSTTTSISACATKVSRARSAR